MKTFKIFVASALLIIAGSTAKAQFVKAEVTVSGLTCSMCQLATEKALKTLDFVGDVKPDLNKNVYLVSFKKDKAVNLDLIKKKVKGAGFSVSKLVTVFNFNNEKISNNSHFDFAGSKYHFMNVSSRTLDGPIRLTVLDKDFIPAGEFKTRSAKTEFECYKTGLMGKTRTYHITL
jgi:copper chaperone CopZ